MQVNQSSSITTKPPLTAYIAIIVAIATISAAAILIRLALIEDMPPALVAGARLLIATIVLTPITLNRYIPNIRSLSPTEFILAAISGICLAIHFTAWVSSLQYTTVLVSVVIVMSGPIWLAILEVIFLNIRLSKLVIMGLLIALAGGILIGIPLGNGDSIEAANNTQDMTLIGAALSWVGAIAISIYMLIGRKLRAKLPVIPYIWLVYGIATLVMLIVVFVTSTPITGFSNEGYLILLAIGLVPQLIGHSSLNYVLEYFPATLVGMFTQLEPIGSAVLAFIIFSEIPPTQQIIGSAIIILGVLLASQGKVSQSEKRKSVDT